MSKLLRVNISTGNSKLGPIKSVSLPPGKACGKAAKYCFHHCYDRRHVSGRFPQVMVTRGINLFMARYMRGTYFAQIADTCRSTRAKRFRWHVGGDILDQNYLDLMYQTAESCPETQFLCFTKRHDLEYKWPKDSGNLVIVMSQWPGLQVPLMPVVCAHDYAWVTTDVRRYADSKKRQTCPGSCTNCWACWQRGKDVEFDIH